MADKEDLNKKLLDYIHCMMQEGLVDKHFGLVYSMKETLGPSFFADMIPEFCSTARDALDHLARTLNKRRGVLDYNLIREKIFKVKGCTLCFGARRMALAFTKFEPAIDKKSKEECLTALKEAKNEYIALQKKLHIVLQMERGILSFSST